MLLVGISEWTLTMQSGELNVICMQTLGVILTRIIVVSLAVRGHVNTHLVLES